MNSNVNRLIDQLDAKIKLYRGYKDELREAMTLNVKLIDQLENIRNEDYFTQSDLDEVTDQFNNNKLHVEYLLEAVDVALYGIKYSAYALGRTKPRPRAEP